jgi:Protein of unknown function (DUF1549)/Protein of unknown function (DUF1553)
MRYQTSRLLTLTALYGVTVLAFSEQFAGAAEPTTPTRAPIYERFAVQAGQAPQSDEVPDFQRHITPLLGRLGCNGRACHGSFQGQGGFRLSLFGYDFKADHDALLETGAARVDLDKALESLILTKPVDADAHEGGKRFENEGWEYWVLRRWIESRATYDPKQIQKIQKLDVTPTEICFTDKDQSQPLKVVAHWEDGTSEDVTCLCRFQSNDSAIAAINDAGLVTSGERGDTHVVVSYDNAVVPIAVLQPLSPQVDEKYPPIPTPTNIDRLVVDKLRKLGIVAAEICTDEEFLRRVSLDVAGTLPTAKEVIAFTSDRDPEKRAKKIEELLNRPTYAAQWTTFLCDITGNNDDQLRNFFPQGVDPSSQWYRWIYERVERNTPYDEIVEGLVTATSRIPNESYRDYCVAMTEACQDKSGDKFADRPTMMHFWARNNFKTSEDRVIGFAYSFLGVRIQCAQCHKHPFDQWSKSDFDNFERLFNGVQANQNSLANDAKKEYDALIDELHLDKSLKGNQLRKAVGEMMRDDAKGLTFPFPELVVSNSPKAKKKDKNEKEPPVSKAKLLGADWVSLDTKDVRGKLMDWLRAPENPYFSKAIVNRVWAAYFSVGIVNPPDDLNLANAPSNAPLLEYLADGFREHKYDFKWLHREILNSDTYQRSWSTNETNEHDKRNFSHSLLRRISAEATHDSVRMALANDDLAEKASALLTSRALNHGGSSSQAPRDDMSYALSVFGRSIRESNCDCDRSSEPSLLQTVFLLNDRAVLSWLNDPRESWVASVAEKYSWPKPTAQDRPGKPNAEAAGRIAEQFAKADQQLSKIEERLGEAKAKGQNQLVSALEDRKQQMLKQKQKMENMNPAAVKRAESQGSAEAQADSPLRMTEEQALWVTESAYLRSLSRKPNSSELSIAVNYLRSESNPTIATENLIWSLLNTKEFIINH